LTSWTGLICIISGPVAGGFLAETTNGWRWILALIAILGGVIWIANLLTLRETYAPVILRRRAAALSQKTGKVYISCLDAGQPPTTLLQKLSTSLIRPWILLFHEPIVLITSLYIAIVYGTLYMFFAGFPIVFEGARGWSQGTAGLPFIGVTIGVLLATLAAAVDNKRYVRRFGGAHAKRGTVPPEARLGNAMVGAVILPIGLFLFAWTTYPSVPWILPVIGALLFSCGLVMVFISLVSYLIDSCTFLSPYSTPSCKYDPYLHFIADVVYAASVMAANSFVRSVFGSAFPLFTSQMYGTLGNDWASSIPAFLALGCLPFPFLFYKYGPQIRSKCKFASNGAKTLELTDQPLAVMYESELDTSLKQAETAQAV
jgi:MFS family permease